MMVVVVYKELVPANAGMSIDYVNNLVRFYYPNEWTYWRAVKKCSIPTFTSFWLSLHIFVLRWLTVLLSPILVYTVTLWLLNFEKVDFTQSLQISLLFFLIPLFYFFFLPYPVVYLLALNKKWLSFWMPKVGYWSQLLSGEVCEKTFMPEEVENNKAVIPAFSNVYLTYEATEDFSKHLERIEVEPLKFQYTQPHTWLPWKKVTRNNEGVFKATFHFKKQPLNGTLKTRFS